MADKYIDHKVAAVQIIQKCVNNIPHVSEELVPFGIKYKLPQSVRQEILDMSAHYLGQISDLEHAEDLRYEIVEKFVSPENLSVTEAPVEVQPQPATADRAIAGESTPSKARVGQYSQAAERSQSMPSVITAVENVNRFPEVLSTSEGMLLHIPTIRDLLVGGLLECSQEHEYDKDKSLYNKAWLGALTEAGLDATMSYAKEAKIKRVKKVFLANI